jgi:hypothetical protein
MILEKLKMALTKTSNGKQHKERIRKSPTIPLKLHIKAKRLITLLKILLI